MINITHIHPMLVHFPIVLFILAVLMDGYIVSRGGDLGRRDCLVMAGFWTLVIGLVFALGAAFFGDIALDKAVDAGFSADPLEEHELLATVTIAIFGALALAQGFALWRRQAVTGARGWLFLLTGLVGIGVLISTAYHGGNLVYELGVNVAGVKP